MSVRLFVGNLPYSATEADIRQHFGTVGDPVHQILDLNILVEVDEIAPALMGKDRPGMGLARGSTIAGEYCA